MCKKVEFHLLSLQSIFSTLLVEKKDQTDCHYEHAHYHGNGDYLSLGLVEPVSSGKKIFEGDKDHHATDEAKCDPVHQGAENVLQDQPPQQSPCDLKEEN